MSENRQLTREESIMKRRGIIYSKENIFTKNNRAWINGIIEDEFEYSHTSFEVKFHKTKVKVLRSDEEGVDYVPIMVPESLIPDSLKASAKGKYIEVGGQFHSYNEWADGGKKYLKLFVYAKIMNIYETQDQFEEVINANAIYLDGYICKKPIYKTISLDKKITDLIVAVNRSGRSDYIPCVALQEEADYASKLKIGNRIKLYGRAQSRKYFKRYEPDFKDGEFREAYEISVVKMKTV